MSMSQSCWRVHTVAACRSQPSTACAAFRFRPFPPERSSIRFDWPCRLRSGRLFSSWSESSTASTRCGWFSTLGRTTPLTQCSYAHLSRFCLRESQMERPNPAPVNPAIASRLQSAPAAPGRWVVRKHTEANGGIYEHFAESENGEALVQGSLDWRRVWGIGRSHPNPVLGLESRFTLRFIGIRRWIVALCGTLDLHPD